MNNDLTIYPIKQEGTEHKLKFPIHPNLPQIQTGQLGILVSPVKTGKSTIISNLLLSKSFYKGQFDIVYIISNTIHNDRTSRFLKESFPNTVFSEYKDSIIENIVKHQESFPKKEQPFIAVIMDDFLGISKTSAIFNFITRFRHYNVGLVLLASQLFRGLPAVARQNATFAIIGGPNPSAKEMGKVCEEFGDIYVGPKNFMKLYNYCCSGDPYHFLYLPLQENPSIAYKDFSEKIYEGRNLVNLSGMDDGTGEKEEKDGFCE